MKKISLILLIISILLASLFALFNEMNETEMFYINTSADIVENDAYVVIERAIISKADGTVRRLKLSSPQETEHGKLYYFEEDSYEYEFCEDTIKEYIFLQFLVLNNSYLLFLLRNLKVYIYLLLLFQTRYLSPEFSSSFTLL